jgi:hypothetical protein
MRACAGDLVLVRKRDILITKQQWNGAKFNYEGAYISDAALELFDESDIELILDPCPEEQSVLDRKAYYGVAHGPVVVQKPRPRHSDDRIH